MNPNLFQDPDYKLGALTHPDARVREKAVAHMLECLGIATALGSSAQSLWLADGTNYPGQDDLRERRRRLLDSLGRVYAELPEEQELLVEYKLFEPAFYATDLADWGSALLTCLKLGERARVLVDLGHHAQGVNIEQIVAFLADEGRLGGFHFNNRKYADDDLIVGSVNPFELFLIFVELAATEPLPRLTIDQSHNIEAKVEAMVLSVVNLQEAYAKALLVDRERAAGRPAGGRRARRPRDPARRLSQRRPPAVRRGARRARRRRGPDREPARVRLRGPHGRRPRGPAGADPMSTVAAVVDHVEDLWPEEGVPGGALEQLVVASNLLGADRAVSNFGGWEHVGEGDGGRSRGS